MVKVSFLPLNFPDYVLMLVLCFDDQDVPSWIGNVLLLKNNLSLSPDITEVSQEKLLSLVAERLIDSNSNVNVILCSFVNLKRCLVIRLISKDAEYAQNQQQNIADAIDLLPRLATGIDVNIKFLRIHDFEFTPECAIFDLMDIPLYHGWIVDLQVCSFALRQWGGRRSRIRVTCSRGSLCGGGRGGVGEGRRWSCSDDARAFLAIAPCIGPATVHRIKLSLQSFPASLLLPSQLPQPIDPLIGISLSRGSAPSPTAITAAIHRIKLPHATATS
ncbi:hypothetical protein RHSIM_Rhsim11G0008100 [Rhododendron simsii]|uniref:MINDY deubiquitinase domain-containing protein n=1 Tax=Rhododendron simsii TaxID=118357 RepID=A0A834G797_RHOSS|nr:hypothetical protein RHSIM_Rhsim11G0008100 [Rhododendron simsii]